MLDRVRECEDQVEGKTVKYFFKLQVAACTKELDLCFVSVQGRSQYECVGPPARGRPFLTVLQLL